MARKKITSSMFSCWEDIDQALREIGQIDRDIALIEATQNDDIDRIKANAKTAATILLLRKKTLETEMQAFCDAHPEEFAKSKTRKLQFGLVNYRLSTKVSFRRGADVIAALKKHQLTHCIRTKETPDKDAIKKLSAEKLAQIGASIKSGDVWGYEINQERLQEVMS